MAKVRDGRRARKRSCQTDILSCVHKFLLLVHTAYLDVSIDFHNKTQISYDYLFAPFEVATLGP